VIGLGLVAIYLTAKQAYAPVQRIPYCTVEGKTLTLNAFIPRTSSKETPAMVDIHGGWFVGGEPATGIPDVFSRRGIAFFSVAYRLGDEGGFPQCIRDCRNAIRFIRRNATKFNVDPNRIAVMGGSAGGHLSLMVAMAPESFEDGGPTEDLKGTPARVCGAFSWIPPTDFIRFWDQGPDDVAVDSNGVKSYRGWNDSIPNDARPHLRSLFHGVAPDLSSSKALYLNMCPIGHVRRGLPPLLICDGERDPIVPGLQGKELFDRLKKVGVDSTYWMTPGGGHEYPSGPGFDSVLDHFLNRIFGAP
jgi:acetyl esterase/lipase